MAFTQAYTVNDGVFGVLFQDATGTPITSPIAESLTKELVVHVSARTATFHNPSDSSGSVTIKTGVAGAADTPSISLDPGDQITLPCAKMNQETGYKTRFFVTTAASTTCNFAFGVDSSDGA